jgi:hypothetical protein
VTIAIMATPPRRPTPRTLLLVAAWGAATTVVAYLISGGNIPLFIAAMVAIGIGQRFVAVAWPDAAGCGHPGGGSCDGTRTTIREDVAL